MMTRPENLNIVNDNGTVFIYLDENSSIEFTGRRHYPLRHHIHKNNLQIIL